MHTRDGMHRTRDGRLVGYGEYTTSTLLTVCIILLTNEMWGRVWGQSHTHHGWSGVRSWKSLVCMLPMWKNYSLIPKSQANRVFKSIKRPNNTIPSSSYCQVWNWEFTHTANYKVYTIVNLNKRKTTITYIHVPQRRKKYGTPST